MTADQLPLAHRWNDDPPMQFHWPSGLQAVPGAKPPELPPPLAGALPLLGVEGTLGAAGTSGVVGGFTTTGGEAGAPVGAVSPPLTVTKTPPGIFLVGAAGGALTTGGLGTEGEPPPLPGF